MAPGPTCRGPTKIIIIVFVHFYSYENAQQLLPPEAQMPPFGSDMYRIVCRLGLSLQRSPDPLSGLGVGPPGKGKEGREGRDYWNAPIQSWQALILNVGPRTSPAKSGPMSMYVSVCVC